MTPEVRRLVLRTYGVAAVIVAALLAVLAVFGINAFALTALWIGVLGFVVVVWNCRAALQGLR